MLAVWIGATIRDREQLAAAARGTVMYLLGMSLLMSPWWVRNWSVYGRFVPTALWLGASLYDGINPDATGASDMRFLSDPQIWPLDEQDQDAELTRRAIGYARKEPLRVATLALVKLGRYWSPWPNAEGFKSLYSALGGAIVEVPIFALMALGFWDRRRDPRALVLLAGPLLYFCGLHVVFASSMRYRVPGEIPALTLAAVGLSLLVQRGHRAGRRRCASEGAW
jgi:hypothetical protein